MYVSLDRQFSQNIADRPMNEQLANMLKISDDGNMAAKMNNKGWVSLIWSLV